MERVRQRRGVLSSSTRQGRAFSAPKAVGSKNTRISPENKLPHLFVSKFLHRYAVLHIFACLTLLLPRTMLLIPC